MFNINHTYTTELFLYNFKYTDNNYNKINYKEVYI